MAAARSPSRRMRCRWPPPRLRRTARRQTTAADNIRLIPLALLLDEQPDMTDDHPAQAPFRASLLLSQALAAGCLMALAAPSTAQAQIAPPGPGAILRQTVQPPAPLLAPGEVLSLPEPNQQESKSTVPIPVGHLTIAGATLIPAETLHELVQPAEGQTLTLQALRDYVNRITEAYHKQGYPVAYAYLPAQKIHEGQITGI